MGSKSTYSQTPHFICLITLLIFEYTFLFVRRRHYFFLDFLLCFKRRDIFVKPVPASLWGMRARTFSQAFCELSGDKLCAHALLTHALSDVISKALARLQNPIHYFLKWSVSIRIHYVCAPEVLCAIELWMVPILLLPRILSCDKNVAALKAPLLVSVLFLLSCECVHSASIWCTTGHGFDLICQHTF